jgi:hypothetical protein
MFALGGSTIAAPLPVHANTNHPPVANAGGPYTTLPGKGLTLDGSASFDPDAPADHIVDYLWDINNDGDFTDASGPSPVISDAQIIAIGGNHVELVFIIYLKVTDTSGAISDAAQTTIRIYNDPPNTIPVVADPSNQTPTISWTYNDVNGHPQAQYEVEVWTGPNGSGNKVWDPAVGTGTGTSVVYAGSELTPHVIYYARVRAYDGYNWGEWSYTSWVYNAPPTTNPVVVTNQSSSTPTIGWTYNDANGDPQAQYEVEVWTGSGGTGTNFWDPAVGTGTATSVVYAGSELTPHVIYYARVRAYDGYNWGVWSQTSWVYNAPPTTNPVVVTNQSSPTPTISWTYNDAEGDTQNQYEVEVWTGPNGSGNKVWDPAVGTGTDTSVVYGGSALDSGQIYFARVRANDWSGWGAWSETSWNYLNNHPPTISDIPDQSTNENVPTTIPFTVGDLETPAGSLVVIGSSSNQLLVQDANIVFGGSGASRTLTITPLPNQHGTATITVVVSDGSLSSYDTFVLTVIAVNTPPTISDIPDQSTNENVPTTIPFTVGDLETTAGNLVVIGSSSNQLLVPDVNIVFGGSGASRTLTITPLPNQHGTATITVVVSDGSLSSYDTFVLTVIAGNHPPTMKSFSINKMVVDFSRQDDHDSINMNASFALPNGVSFDPAKDAVRFNIDGVSIDIPAGSFKGNNKESKYAYDSAKGVEPKVSVNLDFKKGEVTLVVKKANVDIINNSDGVTVTFSIGSIVGGQTINMYINALTYPKQR